jgi:hypothetical protein
MARPLAGGDARFVRVYSYYTGKVVKIRLRNHQNQAGFD